MEKKHENMNISDNIEIEVKRGSESINNFFIFYSCILTITVGIVSLIDLSNTIKIVLIILLLIIEGYFCLFNAFFRNKIIGFFFKVKDFKEKSKK